MDPYLEHPSIWPDVHNSLIAAIRDVLSLKLSPKYYARLEQRLHASPLMTLVGRPDSIFTRILQTSNHLAAGDVDVEVDAIEDEVTKAI